MFVFWQVLIALMIIFYLMFEFLSSIFRIFFIFFLEKALTAAQSFAIIESMKDETMKQFGTRVDELLESRKIDKTSFDRQVGIIAQSRYDWKKGAIPNAVTALKVARFFNVTVEYLLTGRDENPLTETVKELQEKIDRIKDYVKNA